MARLMGSSRVESLSRMDNIRDVVDWIHVWERDVLCTLQCTTLWGTLILSDYHRPIIRELEEGTVLIRIGTCRFVAEDLDCAIVITPSGQIGWLHESELSEEVG